MPGFYISSELHFILGIRFRKSKILIAIAQFLSDGILRNIAVRLLIFVDTNYNIYVAKKCATFAQSAFSIISSVYEKLNHQ